MTISTTASRISHNGNGVTTGFAFPYRFFTSSDLVVVKVSSTGTDTTLVLNTDYTVTGADDDAGGTVTCSVAPASGERLVIYRDMSATQEVDYVTGDAFPAETHERALDRLTMLVQQIDDGLSRSMKVSETSTTTPDDLIDSINASVASAASSASDASDSADAAAVSATAASASADAAAASAASIVYPISVANGGTGSTTAAGARAALGLVIGTDVLSPTGDGSGLTGLETPVKTVLNASGSAPVYACRAWVNFNGTGTVAIRASGNVSSITDNGTGDYTVNFTTAMQDTDYCPVIGASPNFGVASTFSIQWATGSGSEVAPTTSAVRISFGSTTGYHDVKYASVAIFR